MRLAEMKAHHQQYRRHIASAREALSTHRFDMAIERSEAALPFLPGMCRYLRKKENKDRVEFLAVELVLRHAPLLLDAQAIERIAAFYKDNRAAFKYSARDVPELLERSRSELNQAFVLWDALAGSDGIPMLTIHQVPGIEKQFSKRMVEAWFRFGLLQFVDRGSGQRVYRHLRLDHPILTRCRFCGFSESMAFETYLNSFPCSRCAGVEGMVMVELGPKGESR